MGCGWLGLPLGQSFIQKGFVVNGSTTTSAKFPLIESMGIRPVLMALNPEPTPLVKDFFDVEYFIINIPPRNIPDDPHFHEKQLTSLRDHLVDYGVKKVLFVSSTGVYPNSQHPLIESEADETCLSRGGVSLLKMENLFRLSNELDSTIVRFGGLYGPGRHPGNFLKGKTNLAGANNPINMIHLDDCIGVIQKILEEGYWNETFNAVSPNRITRKDFYEKAASEIGVTPPQFSKESASFKEISSQHLQEKTGYQFQH